MLIGDVIQKWSGKLVRVCNAGVFKYSDMGTPGAGLVDSNHHAVELNTSSSLSQSKPLVYLGHLVHGSRLNQLCFVLSFLVFPVADLTNVLMLAL
jgi:hypothetical protein